MGILQLPTILAGEVDVFPQKKRMVTTDDLSTITTAGYMNAVNLQSNPLGKDDILEVLYSFDEVTKTGTYGIFTVAIDNGVITLSLWTNPAIVTLPVVSGDFANFSGTSGIIHDAGFSPTNAAKTKVVMLDAAPAAANNLTKFTSTNGTVGDAGARIIANTTAAYAGGGTSNTFAATGLTVAAKGSAVIRASTNSVSITKALPGTDTLAITFSADPGADTTVDYIYVTASQA